MGDKVKATVDAKVAISAHDSQTVPFLLGMAAAGSVAGGLALQFFSVANWWVPYLIAPIFLGSCLWTWTTSRRAAAMPNPHPMVLSDGETRQSLMLDPRALADTGILTLVNSFLTRKPLPPPSGKVIEASKMPVPDSAAEAQKEVNEINEVRAQLEGIIRAATSLTSPSGFVLQPSFPAVPEAGAGNGPTGNVSSTPADTTSSKPA